MHSSDHAADLIDARDRCLVDAVTERSIISDPNDTSDICMSGNTSGYSDIGDLSAICYAEEPLIISRSCYRQITVYPLPLNFPLKGVLLVPIGTHARPERFRLFINV